jgi:hypothetical protein
VPSGSFLIIGRLNNSITTPWLAIYQLAKYFVIYKLLNTSVFQQRSLSSNLRYAGLGIWISTSKEEIFGSVLDMARIEHEKIPCVQLVCILSCQSVPRFQP